MTTENNNQLALFQFSKPGEGVAKFLQLRDLKKGETVIGGGMKLAKRKDVASLLGLSPKKDGVRLDNEMLRLSDELKGVITREFSGYASSNDYTGLDYTVRRDKHGMATITAKIKQVKRAADVMSDEDIAKLLGLTPDKVAEMKKKASEPPVEVKALPSDEDVAKLLGFSVEDVKAAREAQLKKQAEADKPADAPAADSAAPEPVLDDQPAQQPELEEVPA